MTNPETIANQSPRSQHGDSGGGQLTQIRIELGEKFIVMILALSVLVNIACFWELFILERETRLKEYDLKTFQAEDFAPLDAQVRSMQRELDAVRLQLGLRQELHKER